MLRDDYLHRMIRQLAEFVARISGFTATEQWDAALQETDRAWTDLLDVPRELVDRLDGPTLARLLAEPAKMRLAAELLAAEGKVHQGKRDPVHALICAKRAFELYLEARALDPQPGDDGAIFELARVIPPNEIDPRYRG
ncbi:MAG: hypothetical protein ABI678_13700 [Kofleriaceae bacterium]